MIGVLKTDITRKRRKRKFKPTFNEKQRIIKKYIRQITIDYDKKDKIYIIKVDYNLPIQSEAYLMDFNYMYGYNANTKKMAHWINPFIGEFEIDETIGTYKKLERYGKNL